MKKILKLLKRWRYRHTFRKWYTRYALQGKSSVETIRLADEAFFWLCCCEHYADWYAREYWGVNPYQQEERSCEDAPSRVQSPPTSHRKHVSSH